MTGPFHWNVISGEHIWSASILGLLGIDRADICPNEETLLSVIYPADREGVQYRLANVSPDSPFYEIEYRVTLSDGSQRCLVEKGEVFSMDSGSPLDVIGTISLSSEDADLVGDIAKLKRIVNEQADAVVVIDNSGVTRFANPAAEEITNRASADLIGTQFGIPLSQEKSTQVQMFVPGRGSIYAEMCIVQMKWEGEDAQLVSFRDITQRVEAENALKDYRDNLEEMVAQRTSEVNERTKELEIAKEHAEDANRSKSAFLANMSHEIRTPMNGVVGMVDMLMLKDLESEDKRMVQTIRNSSFSLLRIIDDILDSSKIEAGKLELENIPVQLHPIIEGITEIILPTADAAGARLTVFIDPVLPGWIYSDGTRLRQIFMNLVSNAVKFSKYKDGSKQGHVDILVESSGTGHLRFIVADNGIGMSADALDKLFKPFSQAEQSTTREFGGTGLGLMISKNLTEMLGGTITVDSTLGEGSSFTVTLPYKMAEGENRLPHVSDWTVLALVSDPLLAVRLSKCVEYHGSHIRLAKNKDELMQWLADKPEQMMVFVLCASSQEDDKVCKDIVTKFGPTQILSFTSIRSEKLGLIAPHHYVVQNSPILLSELYKGMAVLAGEMKPDADVMALGVKPDSVEGGKAKNHKILLVEDNEINQDVITMQLKILGYVAEVAEDGQQGFELWKTGRFDLVLTDCHMPNMDGFEMTDAIRTFEKKNNLTHVPIIAITANALQGEAEYCLSSGMDAYLSKPVELVRLRKTLEDWFFEVD